MAERHGGRRRWVTGISLAVAAALVVGGGYAASARGSAQSGLRVAAVSMGPVTQYLTLVGTAQHVNQVTTTFPTSGTVTGVKVTVGQHVTAGQVLATIDPTTLQTALKAAQATLAQDQATLAADQSAGPSASASTTSPSTVQNFSSTVQQSPSTVQQLPSTVQKSGSRGQASSSGGSGTRRGGAPSSGTVPRINTSALQQALASAARASAAADTACAPVLGTTTGTGASTGTRRTTGTDGTHQASNAALTGTPTPQAIGDATDPTTPPPTTQATSTSTPGESSSESSGPTTSEPTTQPVPPTRTTTTSPPPSTTGPSVQQVEACATALRAVQQAQQRAAQSLTALTTQLTKVVTAVEKAATAAATAPTKPSTTGTTGTSGTSHTSTPGSSGATRSAGITANQGSSAAASGQRGTASGSGSGTADQATRVAGDQVAILQDEASVGQAQADLAGATMTAPISGVVAQVGLTTHQPATPQTGIVIVGGGAVSVTVNVPLADMPLVKAGLRARVTPAGATTPSSGYVGAINLLPSSSSSSTPTYPATVIVPDPPAAMPTGSTVTVAVQVASAQDALRVPVSALNGVSAQTSTVTTLSGTTTRTVPVTVGAVGGGWAQIVQGLSAGDQVVVADANTPLPTNNVPGLRGIGGGLGGGGGFVRRSTSGARAGG